MRISFFYKINQDNEKKIFRDVFFEKKKKPSNYVFIQFHFYIYLIFNSFAMLNFTQSFLVT